MLLAIVLALAVTQTASPISVTVQARAVQPGELVVLSITTDIPPDSVSVRAFDRDVTAFRVSRKEWRALVGIDLDVEPVRHDIAIAARSANRSDHLTHTLVVKPKRFATRRLNVDPAFVDPPAGVRERIAEEARLLQELWTNADASRRWTEDFVRPVPHAANSRFGTRSIYNGVPRSPHSGADFNSPEGTPVRAPNAGKVVLARDLYFSGNTVVVDHGLGLLSLLAHLSSIDVKEGDTVAAGDLVGHVGATGRVTGPHLHWGVRASGARVDPLSLLAVLGHDAP
jgi:murein DD-endopeptidase MepM/ murein hydrolase activator NlpD